MILSRFLPRSCWEFLLGLSHRVEDEIIGQGTFGIVSRALWKESHTAVAVKILKNSSSEGDKVRFLQEAAIMGQFHHPNVVKLHGVVTTGEPVSETQL